MKIERELKKATDLRQTFPGDIKITEKKLGAIDAEHEHGGWLDVRDHQLCLNMTTRLRPLS